MASASIGAAESAGASSAVVDAAVSQVPSGGGAGTGGSDSGAVLSDDAILGLESPSSATIQTPAAQPAAQQTPAASAPAELTIDDFKASFPTNPKLQSLWDKYDGNNKLITQFGTVADARKAAETVQMLGGVQSLESLVAKAADVDQTDARFFGGTAEDRKALVNEWLDGEGPGEFGVTSQAVAGTIDAALEVMSTRAPEIYGDIRTRIVTEVLGQHQFGTFLQNIAAEFQGKPLPESVKQLLGWAKHYGLDGQPKNPQSPEAQRLAADRQKLTSEQQAYTQQQTDIAFKEIGGNVQTAVSSEIDAALDTLKTPDGRKVFGENSAKIRDVIKNQVYDAIKAANFKNPVLIAQLKSLEARGIVASKKEMADAVIRHSRLQLQSVMSNIVGEWTKGVISQAAGAAQRAETAASRVDVGSGSSSGGSTKEGITMEQLKKGDYRKFSDDDLLNA